MSYMCFIDTDNINEKYLLSVTHTHPYCVWQSKKAKGKRKEILPTHKSKKKTKIIENTI